MKAVVIAEAGLALTEVPTPKPSRDQMLVRVAIASLNRADLGMAQGHKHGAAGGAGAVAGLEWAGEVVEVGSDCNDFVVGDRVMCSGSGGYAEYAISTPERTMKIPDALSDQAAACLPVALTTMHDAIITNGDLKPEESILIQGASSGVGIVGMQVAKIMGAGLVMGSSTTADRLSRLEAYGADMAVDTSDPDWAKSVMQATHDKGVDVIIDQVSASVANDNMKAAAVQGRIVNVGRLGGVRGDFNYDLHALKRLRYIGVTFRTRSREEVRVIKDLMLRDLGDHLEAFQIPVDKVFPLEHASEAQAYMSANQHFGKILLKT